MAIECDAALVDQDRQASITGMLPGARAFRAGRFVIAGLSSIEPDAVTGEEFGRHICGLPVGREAPGRLLRNDTSLRTQFCQAATQSTKVLPLARW